MRNALVLLTLAAVGCGGSSSSDNAGDVRTLNTLSQDISAAAATYGTEAGGMADLAACNTDESGYDAQVRPMIGRMKGMGPAMDQMMTSLGHAADADMDCGASGMLAELDRHHGDACASTTDMGPNKAEAQAHVATMTQWADHQLVRSHDMGSMMGSGMGGMGGMGGGGMSTGHCVDHHDGTFTLQP